ncbi:hypothetical protein ABT160_23675 [Streptomyces sp. NPDC001941]|uniref:hypothetical protein n=1 Tax=Streptomyces sp. NPDC001941 TaxID=3154659 RepID=UPI00331C80D9
MQDRTETKAVRNVQVGSVTGIVSDREPYTVRLLASSTGGGARLSVADMRALAKWLTGKANAAEADRAAEEQKNLEARMRVQRDLYGAHNLLRR